MGLFCQQWWRICRPTLCIKEQGSSCDSPVISENNQRAVIILSWNLAASSVPGRAVPHTLREWCVPGKQRGQIPGGPSAVWGKANLDVKIKEHMDQNSSVLSGSKPLTWIHSIEAKLCWSFWAKLVAEIEGRQISKELKNVSWLIQMKKLISVNWTELSLFVSSTVFVWVCQLIYYIFEAPWNKVIWLLSYFHKIRCDSWESAPIRKKMGKSNQ